MVFLLPLCLGGAHPSVNLVLALVLAALVGLSLWTLAPQAYLKLNLVTIAVGIAFVATLVQLLPLPLFFVNAISPTAFKLLSSRPGAETHAMLSLDPPSTAHELVKLAAILCAVVLASIHFQGRHARDLARYVGASGVAVVAVGIGHTLFGTHQPYGVFTASSSWLVSTFVNANHQAGFLGLAAFASAAYAMSKRRGQRWGWLVATVVNAVGVLLTLSRGGILSLVFAFGFVWVQQRWRKSAGPIWPWWTVGALSIVLAALIAQAPIVHELWTLSQPDALSKTDLWRPVPRLIADFSLVGVGRGALSAVYPYVIDEAVGVTVTHLENEPLQALVDWGLLVGLALIVMVVIALMRALRRAAQSLELQLLASGLVFLAAANLGDFSLTLTAVAIPAAMFLATSSVAKPRDDATPLPSSPLTRHLLLTATTALAVVVVVSGALAIGHSLDRDAKHLRLALVQTSKPQQQDALGYEALRWHPCDYLLPLWVAERQLRTTGGVMPAMRWIDRGLHMAPHYVGGHWLAARALRAVGKPEQSLIEYRIACVKRPQLTRQIADEVFAQGKGSAAVASLAIGSGCQPEPIARYLLEHNEPIAARDVLALTTEKTVERVALTTRALLAAGDFSQALVAAADLRDSWPAHYEGYVLGSMTLQAMKRTEAAIALLDTGLKHTLNTQPLLAQKANLLLHQQDPIAARVVALAALAVADSESAQAQAQWLVGTSYSAEGRHATAVQYFQRARDAAPAVLSYRLRIATCRMQMGDYTGAKGELLRAQVDLGGNPAIDEALAKVASAAGREAHTAGIRELVVPIALDAQAQ